MPLRLYLQWFEHYQKEPWGYHAENWRTGQICAALYNIATRPDKPFMPHHFYPEPIEDDLQPATEQSVDQQIAMFRSMMSSKQ